MTFAIAAALLIWAVAVFVLSSRFAQRRSTAQDDSATDGARRVARNAALPIISQLFIRGIDLAIALVLLRLLGPEGNGQYAIAVVTWLYVKTISDFGLSVLAAREIAREPSTVSSIVGETTIVRWAVLAATCVPLALIAYVGLTAGNLSSASALSIAILFLSIIPSSYAEAVNSAFTGLEKMAEAAWLNIAVSVFRAPLVIVLAWTRLEVVGVALAALIASGYSAALFHHAGAKLTRVPVRLRITRSRLRWYLAESWPLLVNGLLVSLFFRVDVFIVQAYRGDTALGVYDAAFKLINLLTIIPAYAILAVFPMLVRRADDVGMLRDAQRRTTYILLLISWLAVVGTVALAEPMIRLLAGGEYLPEGAELLRILIWFAPISFVNGVTQYVLISRGMQRRLLPGFVAAVTFNLIANIASVPIFGARAAALNTVITELVIALTFWLATRRSDYPALTRSVITPLWRPTCAGIAAAFLALALSDNPVIATVAGCLTLVGLGLVLHVIGPEQRELIERLRATRRTGQPAAASSPNEQ